MGYLFINKYYSCNQIKEVEMGWACNTYGGKKEVQQGFGRKIWEKRVKERDNFEVRGLDWTRETTLKLDA